jgi:hypothetical protein
MAWEGTLTDDASCNGMAGENVDATGWIEANKNIWVKQAECFLHTLSQYDWKANYANLNANVKCILSEYCARYAAIQGILYNMVGYTSRVEAEDMVTIHLYRMAKIEKFLKDQDYVSYIKNLAA